MIQLLLASRACLDCSDQAVLLNEESTEVARGIDVDCLVAALLVGIWKFFVSSVVELH